MTAAGRRGSSRSGGGPPPQSYDVIVTAVVPYADDDVVARLFCGPRGRLSAFARKAKRSRRRFPSLFPLAFGVAQVRERRNGELLELVELDAEPRSLALGADVRAFAHAAYAVEVCERLLPEGAPAEELFQACRETLIVLGDGPSAVALRAFELQVLKHEGALPELWCADDPSAPCVAYDPVNGRLLAQAEAGTVPFPEEARRAALLLLSGGIADAVRAIPASETVLLRAVSRLFAAHLRFHLRGPPLHSIAFLHALDAA